eukprot:m.197002 g.197002  ORF g.197002 m.197002 type:complete len:1629 (+) comp39537_c0_seq8:2454-7340(+)
MFELRDLVICHSSEQRPGVKVKSSFTDCAHEAESCLRSVLRFLLLFVVNPRMRTLLLLAVCIGLVAAMSVPAKVKELATKYLTEGNARKLLPLFDGGVCSFTWTDDAFACKVPDDKELKVLELYKVAVPKVAADVAKIKFLDGVDNPLNFPIDSFTINRKENTFTLVTRAWANVEFVGEFLELDNFKAEFTVKSDPTKPVSSRFSLGDFRFTGTWQVGSAKIDVNIGRQGNVYDGTGAPVGGKVQVGSFFKGLGQGLDRVLQQTRLGDFFLSNVGAKFYYDREKNDLALCFTGTPSISGWGGIRLHVLYHRYGGGQKEGVTIGADFKSFRLTTLTQKIFNWDISKIPIIGNVVVPDLGFLVSTIDVEPNLLPDCVDGILKDTAPFPQGISMVAQIKVVPDAAPVKFLIQYGPEGLTAETIGDSRALTVRNVARALGINLNSIKLPPGINDVLNFAVSSLNYDRETGLLSVTMDLGKALTIIPNLVQINNPSVNINVTTSSPRRFTVDAHGLWQVGNSKFMMDIQPQDGGRKGYIVVGSGEVFEIGDILRKIGTTFLPANIRLGFLSAFKIYNPSVKIPIGAAAESSLLYLSGEPAIGSFRGVTFNLVGKRLNNRWSCALGLDFANTRFADVLKELTGKSIAGVKMFDQGLKLGVIVSPADFPGVTFEGPTLKQLGEIKKGITITGVFRLPACGNDPICKFIEPVLGGSSLQLKAVIPNQNEFTVSAALTNIRLGSGATIQSAGLELAISTTSPPSVGIVCQLLVHNPKLLFEGAFRAMPTGELQASLKMTGIWYRAFGINFLSFGNLLMSIKFIPGASPTAFEIGGEVYIGCPGKQMKGVAYVGVDSSNPKNNYFYVSLNRLTISSIVNAFCIRLTVPRALREAGFPRGIEVSYATMEKRVLGRIIPAGFKLKGTLDIIGFRVNADIHLSQGQFIKIDLSMSPLNLAGGMFRLYQHPSRKHLGPYFKAELITNPRKVEIKASGYADLFGLVTVGATLYIRERDYFLEVRTPLFVVFQAYLRITASFGSLSKASFSVHGELSPNNIVEKVKAIIKGGADAATRKISDAQRKVTAAQRPFDDAQRKLRSARDKVNRLCSIRNCGSVCIGCPGWNGCCKKIWRRCIGCPRWNSCCKRITDPVCYAANLACKALRGTAYAALWAAEKLVNVAKAPFYAARAVLESIKVAVKAGAAAANWIIHNALNNLIRIRKLEFDVAISVVKGGRFGGALEVSFLGRSYVRFGFSLRLASPIDMAKDLADRIWRTISGRRRRDVDVALKAAFSDYTERLVESYRPGTYELKHRAVRQALFDEPMEDLQSTSLPPSVSTPVADDDDDDDDEVEKNGQALKDELSALEKDDQTNAIPDTPSDGGEVDASEVPDDDEEPGNDDEKCHFVGARLKLLEDLVESLDGAFDGFKVKDYVDMKSKMDGNGCLKAVAKSEQEEIEEEEEAKVLVEEVRKVTEEGDQLMATMPEKHRVARDADDSPENIKDKVEKRIEHGRKDLQLAFDICHGADRLTTATRDVMVARNVRSMQSICEQFDNLMKITKRKSLKEMINSYCDKFEELYRDDERAQEVRGLVARMCSHFGLTGGEDVCDMSVLKGRKVVIELKETIGRLKEIRVFCSDKQR